MALLRGPAPNGRARGRSHTATHTPRANLVGRRLDFVARPLLPAIRRPDRCVREDDPLVGHRGPYALRRALHGARPPGLVLVREPDELGLERAHPAVAPGARLVELAEANGHVAADDDRTPARLDDDHLQAARVARRRDEAEPGQQLELAVDRLVAHAGRLDPLADRVVVLRARVLELLTLNVNRPSGEEVVAAAVVEVQVRVDDDVDAGEVERLLAQRDEAGVKVGHLRAQLRHAGVDQHAGGGMVDDVDADRPALALDEQLGHEQRRERVRRYYQSTSYRRYDSRREAKSSLRINRCRGLSTS